MLARKALAGTAGAPKLYVEDVFSTYLYTGTGATNTISNSIDLSGKGGLVWIKNRNTAGYFHNLFDTERGINKTIYSDQTSAQVTASNTLTDFGSTGFTLGSDNAGYGVNEGTSNTYVSWTFRKAKKFFDVVTYTGNGGTGTRAISHNLGSTPGAIFIKKTSALKNWAVYHRSSDMLCLNSTAAAGAIWSGDVTAVSSTTFTVYANTGLNDNGDTYVAYLFAHNAGGFGDAGSDNVISCGSFTVDGSGNCSVSLGYEPQWLMVKSSTSVDNWYLFDNMRGFPVSPANGELLRPNTSGAGITGSTFRPTATGFTGDPGTGFGTGIYIAIRRGPMKTPTTGTSVFYPQAISQADSIDSTNVPFPPDLINTFSRDGTNRLNNFSYFQFVDRLRGAGTPNNTRVAASEGLGLVSSGTDAEYGKANPPGFTYVQLKANSQDITRGTGWNSASYGNWINYFFRRAPGFFDVVCYKGTGSARTISHNLGVVPELMILKSRTASNAFPWSVYVSSIGTDGYVILDSSDAAITGVGSSMWNSTAPTSLVFSLGTANQININTDNFVAYLFASLSGVSKVGSYTGNGSSVTVTTNFQPRFILVKRTDSTGNWIVGDSARGLPTGNDPALFLNTTAAETTGQDWVDVSSTGFTVNETALNANVNTGTYLYLAVA